MVLPQESKAHNKMSFTDILIYTSDGFSFLFFLGPVSDNTVVISRHDKDRWGGRSWVDSFYHSETLLNRLQ